MTHRHACAVVFALLAISASVRGQDLTAIAMGLIALIALALPTR